MLKSGVGEKKWFTVADGGFIEGQEELGCPMDGDQLELQIVRDVIDAPVNSVIAEWHSDSSCAACLFCPSF